MDMLNNQRVICTSLPLPLDNGCSSAASAKPCRGSFHEAPRPQEIERTQPGLIEKLATKGCTMIEERKEQVPWVG